MPEFKDMLKYFRMRENLSQSELAEKLGIAPSTISMYEVGKREPDFETEEKIADFFNTDLNTLRGRDIESSSYYLNDETAKVAQEIFENDKVLFDVYRSSDKDRLIAYATNLKALRDMENEKLQSLAESIENIAPTVWGPETDEGEYQLQQFINNNTAYKDLYKDLSLKAKLQELADNSMKERSQQLNAAHDRTDIPVTDEMKKHDDDIMDSDDF